MTLAKAREINPNQITVKDLFWSPYQQLALDTMIPYQEKILNDKIKGAEKSHAITNFKIAAGLEEGEFYGMVFQDSDVSKWIEGAAYSLMLRKDKSLEKRVDEIVDIIAMAQQPDGYLDTYFILKEPENKWKNLLEGHELYCAGHLMEAAAAYFEATGKRKLLNVAEKLADHIYEHFYLGKDPGVPGHQEVEVGLLRLYRATDNEKYMRLASHFLSQRGKDPEVFAKEDSTHTIFSLDPLDTRYNQSHAPVTEQEEAVGHAVRAVYMYRAMADLAALTEDAELHETCRRLWKNITEKKIFITGGIGSDGSQEAFANAYYLPNDMAYNETCAQIGLLFFTKAMLDMEIDGKYADLMELLLYNSIISGVGQDGTHFFYVNPLEVNPDISGKNFGHRHVLPQRPGWYACACCPPNLVRVITSLGKYAWSESDDTIYSHLYFGQRAQLQKADIEVKSGYPWNGSVLYHIKNKSGKPFTFAAHIPGYIQSYTLKKNGIDVTKDFPLRNGYVYLKDNWTEDEEIKITFPLRTSRIYANPRITDNAGCVALMRGPIVYCFEGADNPGLLQSMRVLQEGSIKESPGQDILSHTVCLKLEGEIQKEQEVYKDNLYSRERPLFEKRELTAIPYYLWGNRGMNQMRVWMLEKQD